MVHLKYFWTIVTNKILIQEEIKWRLNSGNVCYHSVRNLLSSRFLSKNIKMKIYRTIILPVLLYGCDTRSFTLRETIDWGCLRTGCGGEYLDRRDMKWLKVFFRKLHNEELHHLYSTPSIIRMINSRSMRWAEYVAWMGRRGMDIGFWWERQKNKT
jgi:hypothetical protein